MISAYSVVEKGKVKGMQGKTHLKLVGKNILAYIKQRLIKINCTTSPISTNTTAIVLVIQDQKETTKTSYFFNGISEQNSFNPNEDNDLKFNFFKLTIQ